MGSTATAKSTIHDQVHVKPAADLSDLTPAQLIHGWTEPPLANHAPAPDNLTMTAFFGTVVHVVTPEGVGSKTPDDLATSIFTGTDYCKQIL